MYTDDVSGRIGDNNIPSSPNMTSGSGSSSVTRSSSTLNEPVSATILRDLQRVGIKLKHVMIPRDTVKELRDWDLWGPLMLCLLLATTLSYSAQEQTATVFAAVFMIVWCGAGVVTLNAALLGGQISFFQSVCVLGYCIFPLNIASILCFLWKNRLYHFVVVGVALVWATRASVVFMAQLVHADREALGVYPVLLFYVTIGWMILVQ